MLAILLLEPGEAPRTPRCRLGWQQSSFLGFWTQPFTKGGPLRQNPAFLSQPAVRKPGASLPRWLGLRHHPLPLCACRRRELHAGIASFEGKLVLQVGSGAAGAVIH